MNGVGTNDDPQGVDEERVASIMADEVSIPGGPHMGRMGLVLAHLAELAIDKDKEW